MWVLPDRCRWNGRFSVECKEYVRERVSLKPGIPDEIRPMLLEGSCHCGAVHFSVRSRRPVPYQRCCTICRKTQGGTDVPE
jgi:hypothetical protein